MGLSLADSRSVRWCSFMHLFGAVAATFWVLTVHLPFLRHLYDFKQPQWESHTSICEILTMRHRMVASADNAFHDLAPPHRQAHNPSADELASLFLFSVSSQVNTRFSLRLPPPWSSRKIELILPVGSWNPAVLLIATLIQLYSIRLRVASWLGASSQPAFDGAASGAWARSDGVVNTCSQGAPRTGQRRGTKGDGPPTAEQVHLQLPVDDPTRLRPGVWHRIHLGRHHNATKDLGTIQNVAEILDALQKRRAEAEKGHAQRDLTRGAPERRDCVASTGATCD